LTEVGERLSTRKGKRGRSRRSNLPCSDLCFRGLQFEYGPQHRVSCGLSWVFSAPMGKSRGFQFEYGHSTEYHMVYRGFSLHLWVNPEVFSSNMSHSTEYHVVYRGFSQHLLVNPEVFISNMGHSTEYLSYGLSWVFSAPMGKSRGF
jgi:hypothetical protein